jgi:hypothetical protein
VAEIVKRTFIEHKDEVVEKTEWEARNNPPEARGWTSYCCWLEGWEREALERVIRAKIPRNFLQVVPSAREQAIWLRGARYELEAAIVAIQTARPSGTA